MPAETQLLLAINSIRPRFAVWLSGRREDSNGGKNLSPLVPQPGEVQCGLHIGDLDDARRVDKLVQLQVAAVLLLCPEYLPKAEAEDGEALDKRLASAGIAFKSIPAKDRRHYDIVAKTFPQAFDFIDSFAGRRVLICCYGGVNRSAAVLVGFLVLRRQVDLISAVQAAMEARGTILTNRSFRHMLVRASLGLSPPPAASHGEEEASSAAAQPGNRPKRAIPDISGAGRTERCVKRWKDVLCCQRKRYGSGSSEQVRYVIGGVGSVVHGFCLEFAGGRRSGIFLNDDQSSLDLCSDAALMERGAAWQPLSGGEFITEVSGHGSKLRFLAADVVVRTNRGREIVFRGPSRQFQWNCESPFAYKAQSGNAVVGVEFDRRHRTCTGVKETSVATSGPMSEVRYAVVGMGHVIHGFCLEFADGGRRGRFVEDDGRELRNILDDGALQRRSARWEALGVNESFVAVSGHACRRHYLAADLVLRTNTGRELVFHSRQCEWYRAGQFSFMARPGMQIIEVSFDLSSHSCLGIKEAPGPAVSTTEGCMRASDSPR